MENNVNKEKETETKTETEQAESLERESEAEAEPDENEGDKGEAKPQTQSEGKKKFSKEVLLYLIFGVLTTVVGWVVYFAIMMGGRAMLELPSEDTASAWYIALYSVAQIVQWVCAVLFAFFTNRKWVFEGAEKSGNIASQLLKFSGGRVVTLVLDYIVTFFGGLALSRLIPAFNAFEIFGATLNLNEIGAKLVAAIIVIIGNYFFSKFLVFGSRRKKS